MKQNPQSARDTNKTIERNKILRLREILMKQLMSLNQQTARDTNDTIEWNRFNRLRRLLEILTKQMNDTE